MDGYAQAACEFGRGEEVAACTVLLATRMDKAVIVAVESDLALNYGNLRVVSPEEMLRAMLFAVRDAVQQGSDPSSLRTVFSVGCLLDTRCCGNGTGKSEGPNMEIPCMQEVKDHHAQRHHPLRDS